MTKRSPLAAKRLIPEEVHQAIGDLGHWVLHHSRSIYILSRQLSSYTRSLISRPVLRIISGVYSPRSSSCAR